MTPDQFAAQYGGVPANQNTPPRAIPFSAQNLNQSQCATQGQEFFQKFRASADTGIETTWQPPEYHFNTRLQTCLMAWQDGGPVGGGNGYAAIDIESGGV